MWPQQNKAQQPVYVYICFGILYLYHVWAIKGALLSRVVWYTISYDTLVNAYFICNDELHPIVAELPTAEILVLFGHWKGHVGKSSAEYEGVHGGAQEIQRARDYWNLTCPATWSSATPVLKSNPITWSPSPETEEGDLSFIKPFTSM